METNLPHHNQITNHRNILGKSIHLFIIHYLLRIQAIIKMCQWIKGNTMASTVLVTNDTEIHNAVVQQNANINIMKIAPFLQT